MIMPDHVHFFAAALPTSTDYETWVTYWKSQFSKQFKRPECRWQNDHWDTRIRNLASYEEKWLYVLHNPVRQGLVSKTEDWPFQGQIHELRWD